MQFANNYQNYRTNEFLFSYFTNILDKYYAEIILKITKHIIHI